MESSKVLADFHGDGNDYIFVSYRPGEVVNMPNGVSRAEAKVVELVAKGLSNQDIAKARGVSKRTIDGQVASVFRRLGVNSRAELLAAVFSSTT